MSLSGHSKNINATLTEYKCVYVAIIYAVCHIIPCF